MPEEKPFEAVTPIRISGMDADNRYMDALDALQLALAVVGHRCDECDPPMILCDDPDCQPYGEHHQQLHRSPAKDRP
jgi:hypothetical protein